MRLIDYVNQGGSITWLLVAMNVLGLSLIGWRFFAVWDFKKKIPTMVSGLVDEVVGLKSSQVSATEVMKDKISAKIHNLEFGMNTVRIIATIAPLLGLLGTVVGIFEAFQVIAASGLNNPGMFAKGISYALITTIAGLLVAIPHYVAHNLISAQLDDLEMEFEKQALPELVKRVG